MRIRLAAFLLALIAVPALGAPLQHAPEPTQAAARTIAAEVARATGLHLRWSGLVWSDPSVQGAFVSWGGHIHLDPDYAREEARTAPAYGRDQLLTHEMMHTASVGISRHAYSSWMGWEEGVAEGMRRIIQPDVFRALGYTEEEIAYALWATGDAPNARPGDVMYGTYLNRLERARVALGMAPLLFYRTLIRTPVAKRRHVVRAWAVQRATLSDEDRRFIRRFTSPLSIMTAERYI